MKWAERVNRRERQREAWSTGGNPLVFAAGAAVMAGAFILGSTIGSSLAA